MKKPSNPKKILLSIVLILLIISSVYILYFFWPHSTGTSWYTSDPILSSNEDYPTTKVAVKDPSLVFFEGKWHVFFTGIFKNDEGVYERTINYVSSDKLEELNSNPRFQIMPFSKNTQRTAAPCVFYFEPQQKWYLVAQALYEDPYTPVFSTTNTISDPSSWSEVKPLANKTGTDKWIDFWVICDEQNAYLFYTSNHNAMHYMKTAIEDFPKGFSGPHVADGDIKVHEACMIYKIKEKEEFCLITEGRYQVNEREFFISRSNNIEGPWTPSTLLVTGNDLIFENDEWSKVVSHGEFIRSGHDQKMEICSSSKIEFLFQGVASMNLIYDEIHWQLGIIRNFQDETEGVIYSNEN